MINEYEEKLKEQEQQSKSLLCAFVIFNKFSLSSFNILSAVNNFSDNNKI